ncbi:filaggrin isoform X3 [Gadus morhua]|uniref:filaggrin isoform X3 n=1 Tax=Gadus morhua TaxID=8049 RepID=UPI0011B77C92|nr:filaggrin-like isoform X3 [Gadus morhua]
MNPPYWDRLPRARYDHDRPQCPGTEQDMGQYTFNYNDQHYHQDHYRYHQREPQRPTRRMDYGQHSIPSPSPSPGLISCREPSVDLGSDRTVIPDGPSVELAEIDNELERKKKKLEEIENRIIRKKAAIALKKILPYLRKTDELSDNPLDDQKDLVESCLTTTNESSLKERVNSILQLRKSLGFPKMHSRDPKSSTTYGVGRQEDHPLKLRVKTLMDNRSRTLRENPSFPPPTATLDSRMWHAVDGPKMQLNPLSRSQPESSTVYEPWPTEGGQTMQVDPYPPMERAKESPSQDPGPGPMPGLSAGFQHVQPHGRSQTPRPASPSPAPPQRPAIARGMQRFLNLLNKGVDMDLFTSIVNDDSKSVTSDVVLPLNQPPRREPSRSENDRAEPHPKDSHPSQSEPRSRSRWSTELPDTEGSPKERSNSANDDGRGISAIISSSRHCPLSSASSGPRAEEENPMQLQLQNILKTLGLSLDKEEMSGLTSRTDERLNGKRKDNGQGFHNPSGSEMPFEPAPEPCDGTSTSAPPQSRPAGRPPPQHRKGEGIVEGRKRRRLSPCSQSVDRSSGDSGQRGRRTDGHKRRETDSCGDAGTDPTRDGEPSGASGAEKRQKRGRHGDPETYSRQEGDRHGDSETYRRRDGDRHGDSETHRRKDGDPETYRRKDGDRHGVPETYRRRDGDRHGDSETCRRQDGDHHENPKTYSRQDEDRHGDPETYRRRDGDRHGDSETYRKRDGDRHGDSETYMRQDEDRHGNPETYSRQDGDRHGDPVTYRRKDGDRHGDPVTYRRQDGDRHGDPETYRRQEGDRNGDPETYRRQEGDRHGDPETYSRQDEDRHGDPETYRRQDGDRHGDSETCRRQDGDHHGNPKTYSRQDESPWRPREIQETGWRSPWRL